MSESKSIRLGDLGHDPVAMAQPGQSKRITQLDDLLASIPVHGLNQSLRARDGHGVFEFPLVVVAGNRRLAALRAIRDAGGTIKGEAVTDDWLVPVIVSDLGDDEVLAVMTAENVQRVALTPLEEFRAFAAMATRSTIKDVAAHFAVPEKRVRQRLKLAELHPDVLEALDGDKISMASAEAFTLGTPEQQAAFLKKAKGNRWELEPHAVKRAFTQKLITSDSTEAKLIGAAAYKAAGGELLRDQFGDITYWISTDLIPGLLEAHWASQVEAWTADGWSFVETATEFCGRDRWKIYNAERVKPSVEDGSESGSYAKADKAKAGVVYFPSGSEEPIVGIKRYVERAYRAPDESLAAPGHEVKETLTAAIHGATGTALDRIPLAGLRLLVASLHRDMRDLSRDYSRSLFNILVECSHPDDLDDNGDDRDDPPELPQGRTFAAALAWAAAASESELLAHLDGLARAALELGHQPDMVPAFQYLKPDVGAVFDADAYFAKATKPLILEALRDMGDTGKPKGKQAARDALAETAVALARDTGWLPPQLRAEGYAGPMAVTDKPESEAAEDDDDEEFVEDELAESEEQLEAAE